MSGGGGEWVPLYITFFLGVILLTIVPSIVSSFCDIEDFISNPNFSPSGCPVNDFSMFTSNIVNFIANGFTINLWGILGNGINLNIFSVFGLFPDNVVQRFFAESLSAFAFLPDRVAFISLALFFIGLIYTTAKLIRG